MTSFLPACSGCHATETRAQLWLSYQYGVSRPRPVLKTGARTSPSPRTTRPGRESFAQPDWLAARLLPDWLVRRRLAVLPGATGLCRRLAVLHLLLHLLLPDCAARRD